MLTIRNEESRAVIRQFALCALILAFVLSGCRQLQRQEKEEDEVVLATSPDAAMTSVPSDFAAKAVNAAGGLNAWTKSKEIHLASVVTLYQPDGSHYLSELQLAVYPWSNSIQVSANEPEGQLLWQLSKGQFKVLQGDDRIDELSKELQSRDLAEAVLSIVTAPARLLDKSADFAEKGSPVKIQGQWHQPIERLPRSGILAGPRLSGAVFYQNRDNSLIDMIQFESAGTGQILTVRGYDHREIEKGGALVPAGIEIFTTDSQANAQDRLVKIDSHTLGSAK
jgi:hypothetical protein